MSRSPRDRFLRERARVTGESDGRAALDPDAEPEVVDALARFADALDEEIPHVEIPIFDRGRFVGHDSLGNNTAKNYLSTLRCSHQRGLDLLDADAETVNHFVNDLVIDPDSGRRRHGIVDWDGSLTKGSANTWVSAYRAFYRWATDPAANGDRPPVGIAWEDVDGSERIAMFSTKQARSHVNESEDNPDGDDLDAMRRACLRSQNTRRDRAFLETAAGTGQRVYPLVTLRVKGVRGHIENDCGCPEYVDFPHVLLNPEIAGDGDKDAIAKAGRVRPFVANPEPVLQWIRNHTLRDPELREEVGAPEAFRDCFVFVGDPAQRSTELADNWGDDAARDMLERRKGSTAGLAGVETVTADVNPHAWRAWAYSRSKNLPIPEKARRAVFGWAPGSDVGATHYDKSDVIDAMREWADAHVDAFGGDGAASVDEQVAGGSAVADLSPEAKDALREELAPDEPMMPGPEPLREMVRDMMVNIIEENQLTTDELAVDLERKREEAMDTEAIERRIEALEGQLAYAEDPDEAAPDWMVERRSDG